jgi:ergothioneine biosynthesis protein EgtB
LAPALHASAPRALRNRPMEPMTAADVLETRRQAAIARFRHVRRATERLAEPLSPEDQGLQSMVTCSPTKWHRGHTTWFFEAFLLGPYGSAPVHAGWSAILNSYYVGAGPHGMRRHRGLLSRPSAAEIGAYRARVDERVVALLERASSDELTEALPIVELGLAHEEQHQELLLTDILNAFSHNPLRPTYREETPADAQVAAAPLAFRPFGGGVREIGAPSDDAFRFDNEEPRHRVFVEPFALASRLVTVGEWKAFADAGGYRAPLLWLSDGFDWATANGVRAPLYCEREGGALVSFGLGGARELGDAEPITHVSFYEADAIARFLGARLPSELEWEVAATGPEARAGNFLEGGLFRAAPAALEAGAGAIAQLFGDAWEWTTSAYAPYPGFAPRAGVIGEYNGKFMVNQLVLRGGSCWTPRGHVRPSYRNFWYPNTRFQVTGIRLARSVAP